MILSIGFCLLFMASCSAIIAETETDADHYRDESEYVFGKNNKFILNILDTSHNYCY